MLITRLVGSVIYHAYSHAIQSACKPLTSDLTKFVKTHMCLLHASVKFKLNDTVHSFVDYIHTYVASSIRISLTNVQ